MQKSDEPNYFREILAIFSEEELLRFRKRFQMAGNARMADVMTDELEEKYGPTR